MIGGLEISAESILPMYGVAIDAGSSLADAIREARGDAATKDDLKVFKAAVTRTLSGDATTVLVDSEFGRDLLEEIAPNCAPMLAYEADAYLISDTERVTITPENLTVTDYPDLGVGMLKFFMYYSPRSPDGLNRRKQDLVAQIGAECKENGVIFLFEPLIYDEMLQPGTEAYARLKPEFVRQATAIFAAPRYGVDVLKVEVPIDLQFVDGFGTPILSQNEARDAFRRAADASGDIPIVYLSAGVTFDQFRNSIALAREAEVSFAGFMCGRAIWSDGIGVFGKGGEAALTNWLKTTGRARLRELIAATQS